MNLVLEFEDVQEYGSHLLQGSNADGKVGTAQHCEPTSTEKRRVKMQCLRKLPTWNERVALVLLNRLRKQETARRRSQLAQTMLDVGSFLKALRVTDANDDEAEDE
ncbi:hypothetical protein H257_08606 [Aphanomyces astaci]|uniref:Uncharacterized protein n=1 Tax=Aphanomyces astaci TaxID=112090 RepID=W4GDK7_APHAT|nr:hypothetical protein H257_08606 [Aphanomyces astaci]ETV77755.1 hypothetical protein H257_08606 [Aphanomyces astaci]|eukprot:XP_009832865.1 hypothetical protein H257_08606 [Aphanomyces astaci]